MWLSPNLPTARTSSSARGQENILEWEGLIEMYLNKEQYRSIKTKVFQKDLLEGTLISNLQKIFVMPVYKELSNMHLLA